MPAYENGNYSALAHLSGFTSVFKRMKTAFIFLLVLLWLPSYSQEKTTASQELFLQGQAAHEAGRYKDAIRIYTTLLEKNPEFKEAYFSRAVAREQLRDLRSALTDYSIFLEMDPLNYEALFARGNVLFRLNKFESARDDFSKLLELPAGETNTVLFQRSSAASGISAVTTAQSDIRHMVYNSIGLIETRLKNYTAAIKWFDSAIAAVPDNPDYYANRALAWEKIDVSRAAQDYDRALDLNPNHTQSLLNKSLLKSGNAKNSAEMLDKAVASDSTMLAPYLERAYQRLQGGFYKGALEDYSHALEIESSDPEIWLNRGVCREKLNDLKGAYSDYTKALTLQEDFDKAWLNRGNVLSRQGRYREAVEDYTAALAFNPSYAAALYNRAIAKEKLNQIKEACTDLQKAAGLGQQIDPRLKARICHGN